ncbi:MAG: tetratricopeptide repeat protein [Telmatospirillum sp.]|nr:tetratricopeptide repeat protein [Telmatospirillum sp.]
MTGTAKALVRRMADVRYATRFFVGAGIDIGAGSDPLSLYAEQFPLMTRLRVWDMPDGDAQKLATIPDESLDFAHSSHCLEHMVDPTAALQRWFAVVKPGGHLVLLIPDEDLYEQGIWPSNKNADHKWTFALYKKRSWSPKSINVLALLTQLPASAETVKLEKLDASYRYRLPPLDQTLTPIGECGIEIVLRKRLPAEIDAGGRLPKQGALSRAEIHALTGLNVGPAPAPAPAPTPAPAPAPAVPDIGELLNRAVAAQQAKNFAAAEALYREVLAQSPDNFDATHLLGVLFRQRGDSALAVGQIRKALVLAPRSATAYGNLGNALRDVKRFDDALACYESVLVLQPQNAEAHFQRGNILRDMGQHEAAAGAYSDSLALRPNHADTLNGLGNSHYSLDRPVEAVEAYRAALAANPAFADAYSNCAVVLRVLGRHDEALAYYEKALALKPDFHEAETNRGVALCDLGRYAEAREGYARVLAAKPDDPLARMNSAMCALLLGDFESGWPNYEWRWQAGNFPKPQLDVPQWMGEADLTGKRILLYAEQGLGDTIQFVRYAPMVAARGARVVVQAQSALKSLLRTLDGVESVLDQDEKLPPIDLQCPLMSLPLAFETQPATIPAAIPYLRADLKRVAYWRKKLGQKDKKRIGLVWSGNTAHKNDRNRSIKLAELAPLFAADVTFFSLQKEMRDEDAETARKLNNFVHFGATLQDFADTAALVESMDLVVAVDTSVLHLAGALGKRTLALIAFNPDWRWMLEDSQTRWYPNTELVRQSRRGDWSEALKRIYNVLIKLA